MQTGGIVGEFDGDRRGKIFRHGTVQLLYGQVGLVSLIKANKAHALGLTISVQNTARNYLATAAEISVHLLNGPVSGHIAYVQVGAFYCVRTGPSVGHFNHFVLNFDAVEVGDRFFGILHVCVVDKAVAQVLIRVLVSYEFTALDTAYGLEESFEFVADHGLWQIVDYEICFAFAGRR